MADKEIKVCEFCEEGQVLKFVHLRGEEVYLGNRHRFKSIYWCDKCKETIQGLRK